MFLPTAPPMSGTDPSKLAAREAQPSSRSGWVVLPGYSECKLTDQCPEHPDMSGPCYDGSAWTHNTLIHNSVLFSWARPSDID